MDFAAVALVNAARKRSGRPQIEESESIDSFLKRLDAWKAQGEWVPACGRTEVPFLTSTGHRLLYCYQPRSGRHAYLDLGSDTILTDEEARNLMQK